MSACGVGVLHFHNLFRLIYPHLRTKALKRSRSNTDTRIQRFREDDYTVMGDDDVFIC